MAHQCPKCGGGGKIHGVLVGSKLRTVPCSFCKSVGYVSDSKVAWHKLGERLRRHRMEVLGLTLRKLGQLKNISPTHLSQMEQGVEQPQPIFYDGFVQ